MSGATPFAAHSLFIQTTHSVEGAVTTSSNQIEARVQAMKTATAALSEKVKQFYIGDEMAFDQAPYL